MRPLVNLALLKSLSKAVNSPGPTSNLILSSKDSIGSLLLVLGQIHFPTLGPLLCPEIPQIIPLA
jgi:hypothetical protein